ncbi:MAG: methyltransferase domain-containing protein [Actinobacteria bacterium]|nr:methyltransferase domain-containing protein [Actinomycetota bacterium]
MSTFPKHSPLRVRFFDRMMRVFDRKGFADWRERLVGDLRGVVVELGTGTGLNFAHYRPGAHVLASDRDPLMLTRAVLRAREAPATISISVADVMLLPFADDSADAIVIALMLCSVPDQRRALSEVRRVLRPGGHFRCVEHVRDEEGSRNARFQDRWNPLYTRVSGGCNWNRRTLDSIVEAGFEVRSVTKLRLGLPPTAPHILVEAMI